jgi:hypothetical protein
LRNNVALAKKCCVEQNQRRGFKFTCGQTETGLRRDGILQRAVAPDAHFDERASAGRDLTGINIRAAFFLYIISARVKPISGIHNNMCVDSLIYVAARRIA